MLSDAGLPRSSIFHYSGEGRRVRADYSGTCSVRV